MPNSYFQFKQFTIHQDRCAMKVCTDACILGAWAAGSISHRHQTILDIGSGTGLQMLMVAQKTDAEIHGIEIDTEAFEQLQENTRHSPWKDRLTVFGGDARNFSFHARYDFIISNPPFYENDLASPTRSRQLAMHSTELTLEDLMKIIDSNLMNDGSFALLLPYHRFQQFDSIAQHAHFFLQEKLTVKQGPGHAPFRVILKYARSANFFPTQNELTIHDAHRNYTSEFIELLQDYYLHL